MAQLLKLKILDKNDHLGTERPVKMAVGIITISGKRCLNFFENFFNANEARLLRKLES